MAFPENTPTMRFLKKMLLAIALIIVVACLKYFFVKWFPVSAIFYGNLLGSLQFLILFWALFTGLLEIFAWTRIAPRKARRNSSLTFISVIATAEIVCAWLLFHPRSIPDRWHWAFHYYYENYQRDILQYNKNIAAYDSTLFYRLRSAHRSEFRNIEFADSIFTDDRGFRNANIDLTRVNVVCLGDSYTVGWGVGQEETYPSRLGDLLGSPVLNTGVSSYGTVREVESIRNLDMPNAHRIIIQYSNNDADENEAWLKHGYQLPVSTAGVYDSACREVEWSKRYFPGKFFCTLSKLFLQKQLHLFHSRSQRPASDTDPGPAASGEHDAGLFIGVLKHSGWDFNKVQVLVFSIDEATDSSVSFVPALSRQLMTPENDSVFKGHVHLLHIAPLLNKSDYYLLDDHLRPSGQQKIANALAMALHSLP